MVTFSQLVYNRNKTRLVRKKYKNKRRVLENCPQKKGTCIRVAKTTPKKPNSANRPYCRVVLSNKEYINCHIPGETHTLKRYSPVLIRGGRVPDMPGIKYRVIRGKFDLFGLLRRKNGRSKYGTKDFDRLPVTYIPKAQR
jgi:small subunit ribosomal protein S12